MGLSLTLPMRDRAGQAALANSLVRKKSDTLSLRSREQGVRLDVLNAISQVESSRESVKLAIIARDLAQKQLDAEQQKYDLGTSTDVLSCWTRRPGSRRPSPRWSPSPSTTGGISSTCCA